MNEILYSSISYLRVGLASLLHGAFLCAIFAALLATHYLGFILLIVGYMMILFSQLIIDPPDVIVTLIPSLFSRIRIFERKSVQVLDSGVIIRSSSISHLFTRLNKLEGNNYPWIEAICSTPKIITKRFQRAQSAEDFFYKNQMADYIDISFNLEVIGVGTDRLNLSQVSIIALYPSGALRSLLCHISFVEGKLNVSIDDYLDLLDPDQVQPISNIRAFKGSVTVFAVQC